MQVDRGVQEGGGTVKQEQHKDSRYHPQQSLVKIETEEIEITDTLVYTATSAFPTKGWFDQEGQKLSDLDYNSEDDIKMEPVITDKTVSFMLLFYLYN